MWPFIPKRLQRKCAYLKACQYGLSCKGASGACQEGFSCKAPSAAHSLRFSPWQRLEEARKTNYSVAVDFAGSEAGHSRTSSTRQVDAGLMFSVQARTLTPALHVSAPGRYTVSFNRSQQRFSRYHRPSGIDLDVETGGTCFNSASRQIMCQAGARRQMGSQFLICEL